MGNRHRLTNQTWEISSAKPGHLALPGYAACTEPASAQKEVPRLQAGAATPAQPLSGCSQGPGLLTRAATGLSAQYLPGNKDLDGFNLMANSCQTCVIVSVGN